jgi:hypothetical protein
MASRGAIRLILVHNLRLAHFFGAQKTVVVAQLSVFIAI